MANIPEIFEGCVDFKAPAVHVSNVGSSQFHLTNSQPRVIVLEIHNVAKNREMKPIRCNYSYFTLPKEIRKRSYAAGVSLLMI